MRAEPRPRSPRRFQPKISLRVFLGACVAIAVLLGLLRIYLSPLVARADAENDLLRMGAMIQRGKTHFFLNPLRPGKAKHRPAGSNWESLLSRVTQRDIRLDPVTGIHFFVATRPVTDNDMQHVSLFPEVEVLDLVPPSTPTPSGSVRLPKPGAEVITDAGFEKIAALPKLRALLARSSKITDQSCQSLSRCESLEDLGLNAPLITDDGLQTLGRMPALKSLELTGTRVTTKAVEELRRRRPELKVKLFPATRS